jgi:hypothetical protein
MKIGFDQIPKPIENCPSLELDRERKDCDLSKQNFIATEQLHILNIKENEKRCFSGNPRSNQTRDHYYNCPKAFNAKHSCRRFSYQSAGGFETYQNIDSMWVDCG